MATTPSGVTITATAPDGATHDVTESIQTLYDLLIQSLDWGSGFFGYEDAVPVARLARVCGFEQAQEAERYLAKVQAEEAREAKRQADWAAWRIANPDAVRHTGIASSAIV